MAKYIELEALGIGKCNPEVFEDKGYANGWNAAIDIIQNAPAADVVPVVRCGECKFADNYGLDLMCQKHSGITKSKLGEDIHFVEWHSKNFFCSDGVRMKNDG